MNIKKNLNNSDFFHKISESSGEKLFNIGKKKSLSAKEILFLEGQKGQNLYLLLEGSIKLYKNSTNGKFTTIKIVIPGEIFAEIIIFEKNKYPVNAIALKKSIVFSINKSDFINLLCEKKFRNEFITLLMKKQRYLTERIVYLTSCDVEERFFKFLKQHYGKKKTYRIEMSKKDIALSIGTIPETFSRLINRLKEEKKITWEKSEQVSLLSVN